MVLPNCDQKAIFVHLGSDSPHSMSVATTCVVCIVLCKAMELIYEVESLTHVNRVMCSSVHLLLHYIILHVGSSCTTCRINSEDRTTTRGSFLEYRGNTEVIRLETKQCCNNSQCAVDCPRAD